MSIKEFTCTECYNHCHLTVTEENGQLTVSGNKCPRGDKHGREEFAGDRKVVRGFVRSSVDGVGKVPVETSTAVSKGMVYKVTLAIKHLSLDHPVTAGDVVCPNISNTEADLIVSR